MQFFGFVVINEDTDNSIFESRIMNYDPTIFNTLKETIRTSDSLIAATEVNIQAAIDGQLEWDQITIYESVIEADIVTGIEKVSPTNTYVLRPAEATQIRADIAAQVASIKSEQAAAEKAANEARAAYAASLVLADKVYAEKVASGLYDEFFQGHINEDEDKNTGGVVASIIGGLLLIALTIFLMCKAIRMRRFNEMCASQNRTADGGNSILVN